MANHPVFISHSGRDTWVARQIARECQQAGATVFLDESGIAIGADFEAALREALNEASKLLVVFTPWALARPYIWLEIGVAWNRQIPIAVVLHGLTASDLRGNSDVPVLINQRNMIDINSLDRYFKELKARLEIAAQPTSPS